MSSTFLQQGPHPGNGAEPSDPDTSFTPIPSSGVSRTPTLAPASASTITQLICDERAIASLLENLLYRSGLTLNEAARRLGITPSTLRQYTSGRRSRPSLIWFVRFASMCGARISLDLPEKR